MAPGSAITSFKGRSGRLQAFARGASGSEVQNGAAVEPNQESSEKPAELPQNNGSQPTRQEIVENARIPIPRVGRPTLNHNQGIIASRQALPSSPHKNGPGSPQKRVDESRYRNMQGPSPASPARLGVEDRSKRLLFEGSQLGESFLHSGITTPHNEYDEAHIEMQRMPPQDASPERDTYAARNKDLVQDRLYKLAQSRDSGPFQMGENGFITVKSTADKRDPSYMRDGFQTNSRTNNELYQNGRGNRDPSADRHTKLAIREVKIRRLRDSGGRERFRAQERPRSPTPDPPNPQWPEGQVEDGSVDSEVEGTTEEAVEELEQTPRPKRSRASPVKELMESAIPAPFAPPTHNRSKKRNRASPDYDDAVLNAKTFAELQNEPFDFDPSKQAIRNGPGASSDDLSAKLDQVQYHPEQDQRSFFTTMPVDDWEASGDWFVEQFASIMNRLKDARKTKRQMIQGFEEEAAHREEAVRRRSEAIDMKLIKMKQNGQRVIGD